MTRARTAVLIFAASLGIASCSREPEPVSRNAPPASTGETASMAVPVYTYEVVQTYPHDPDAYCQGLVLHEGELYESTGLNGKSSLRQVDLPTGKVLKKVEVPSQYFGEGLAIYKGQIFQLTWTSEKGFIYDLASFQLIREFAYDGEGWGLTHDGKSLIKSDGSHRLRFLSPGRLEVERTVGVYDGSQPVANLNELEYVKGEVYANIYQTDRIARIDPASGKVLGWIDLAGLLPPEDRRRPVDVLNGIAYDQAQDRLFVTGKLWPKLFEIRLKRK